MVVMVHLEYYISQLSAALLLLQSIICIVRSLGLAYFLSEGITIPLQP